MNEKTDLISRMNTHLENACAYHAIREKELFCYCVGRAEAIRDLLEDYYGFFEKEYSEHTRNMWDIVEEDWQKGDSNIPTNGRRLPMFEIRKADWYRSCAACDASNHESKNRKKVDTIYEVKIGIMVNALCADCMLKLANQISEEIEI